MTTDALRALARELAPLIAEELGLDKPSGRPAPTSHGRYDHRTIVEFLSPLHLGDSVLLRARVFFKQLAKEGRIGSLELVELLDLKGATSIPANLTNPLKKRAARLDLEVPWDETADRDDRTVWVDRDGIAARMLQAIDEEIRRRGLR
jgi:hypothetical protein